jgi:hypothetical protein
MVADFKVIIDSSTKRVIRGGFGILTAGSGEQLLNVNPTDFISKYEITDHKVASDGTITLNPRAELTATLPVSGDWISKQDRIIGISNGIPDIDDMDVEWWDNSASSLIDKTSSARLNDSATTGTILDQTADYLYIGAHSQYSKLIVDVETGSTGGTLIASYWNGAWTSLTITDGTSNLSADGNITFTKPFDWEKGGTPAGGSLDSNLYYIRLNFTSITTGPDIDQIVPDLGNFQENGIVIENIHEHSENLKIILVNTSVAGQDGDLTLDIDATRDGLSDEYEWRTQAQTIDFTPASPSEGEVFHIYINGTDYNYTAPASPTVADITAGLTNAINPHQEVTATDVGPGTLVRVTSDWSGDPFNTIDAQYFDADLGDSGTLVDLTDAILRDDGFTTDDVWWGDRLRFDSGDWLYVGQERKFTDIDVKVLTAAANGGVLQMEYWTGEDWSTGTITSDGTYAGGSSFNIDGRITFTLPSDWGYFAHSNIPGLDRSTLYYIRLKTTNPTSAPAAALDQLYIVNEEVTSQSTGSITSDFTTININRIDLKLKFETQSSVGTYDITFDSTDDIFHHICFTSVLVDTTVLGAIEKGAFEVKTFSKSKWLREEPSNSPANGTDTSFNLVKSAIREDFKVFSSQQSIFSTTVSGIAIANEYFLGTASDGIILPSKVKFNKIYLTARTGPVGSACDIIIKNITDATSQTYSIADGTTFLASSTAAPLFDAGEKLAIQFGANIGTTTAASDITVVMTGMLDTTIGLMYIDPNKYTINYDSTDKDKITGITFTIAPLKDSVIIFEFQEYDTSFAKEAITSNVTLTRRFRAFC